MKEAEIDYINNILYQSLEEKNSNTFWKYIKARKQDSTGMAPLKENYTVTHKIKLIY